MKINNFTKCTLAVELGFGLNSTAIAEAQITMWKLQQATI